jgi:hypothetical protein
MAQELRVVLAMAAIVLAITTWAAAPNPESDLAATLICHNEKNPIAIQYRNLVSRYWQTTCAASIFAVP